jgi:anaerobic selenocysteine-containing dehydrogenase
VLARTHYDFAFYQLAVHNVANYSAPVIEREAGSLDEWELFLRLAGILAGQGPEADPSIVDDLVITTLIHREIGLDGSNIENRDVSELLEALSPRRGPERMLDFLLRSGPYGDAFGKHDGISLKTLEAQPHGVDFGPLQPRIPEILRTPSGKIELAPQPIAEDVKRLLISFEQSLTLGNGHMLLIGRRDLRSNNSWMHNLHVLTKGKERCTLHIHPNDAAHLELLDGNMAIVASRAGSVAIPIEITDAIMQGVVSIPHGWGHALSMTRMRTASEHAGVNTNILSDEMEVDPLSGNAVLNGIPVTVEKVPS